MAHLTTLHQETRIYKTYDNPKAWGVDIDTDEQRRQPLDLATAAGVFRQPICQSSAFDTHNTAPNHLKAQYILQLNAWHC